MTDANREPTVTYINPGAENLLVREMPIRVVTIDEFRDWHRALGNARTDGAAPFCWLPEAFGSLPANSFRWTCPDCSSPYAARVGPEPISGWECPQWATSGSEQAPSAVPSLGCGLMKNGPGHHWWLRDGRMVAA